MCAAVECCLKRKPVLRKCALEQNNGILGKNSPCSVGGRESETEGDRQRGERKEKIQV